MQNKLFSSELCLSKDVDFAELPYQFANLGEKDASGKALPLDNVLQNVGDAHKDRWTEFLQGEKLCGGDCNKRLGKMLKDSLTLKVDPQQQDKEKEEVLLRIVWSAFSVMGAAGALQEEFEFPITFRRSY